VLNTVGELASTGWTRQETLPTLTLALNTEDSDGERLGAAVEAIRPLLTAAKLTCYRGSDFLTLEIAESGARPLLLTDHAHGTLQATFSNDELPDAEAAFNGDTNAAFRLTGRWHASLNIDPARCLSSADSTRHWLVVPNAQSVETLLTNRPWWELKPLVQPGKPLTIAVHEAGAELDIRTATQRICALGLVAPNAEHPVPKADLETPRRWLSQAAPEGIPTPSALYPLSCVGRESEISGVVRALRRQTTACCWALIATNIVIHGNEVHAEFFGLQRPEWSLGALGPDLTADEHEAAYRLWLTCADATTPDRVLATRQVVSLYRHEPWAYADDVAHSSEPLFLALRSTATAEALQAQREARALALSVARQTADATTALAKNAVERALAVFAAVGAIIVAETSKTLTASQATGLRHLLGIYLFVLAAWSFILEGRPVTSAIGALKSDLAVFSDLLTEPEQQSILGAATVQQATHQAWTARIVVPLAYIAVGVVALILKG
jgi:hypothetical protein